MRHSGQRLARIRVALLREYEADLFVVCRERRRVHEPQLASCAAQLHVHAVLEIAEGKIAVAKFAGE
jgi:hypothetical protein